MTNPSPLPFIASDIGNRKLKYRREGDEWVAEDALVRPVTTVSDDLRGDRLAPLVYLDGPADLDPDHEAGRLRGQPFLVGADAVRGGALDMARVGTATLRITSDAYKVQTLYTIARALPKSLTHEVPDGKRYQKPKAVVEADVIYAGGLPAESTAARPTLLRWLKGEGRRTIHTFTLGETEYRLRVVKALIIAQHIAVTASLSFNDSGVPLVNGSLNRKRLILDAGGGTTDYGGNVGLDVIPGTEGTVRKAAYDIAGVARDHIQARYPGLQVSILDVLAAMDMPDPTVFRAGEPVSVRQELIHAADLITVSVLTDITPRWEAHLSQAEVCLAGGTAAWMLPTIRREYAGVAIRLLEHAIYRVLLGLERLGRHKLRAQER